MKTLFFSALPLIGLGIAVSAYLMGYKSETYREIRELHDSRLKDIYYYTVRK